VINRVDSSLQADANINIEVHGIPIAMEQMDVAHLLHQIDNNIDPVNIARAIRILPALRFKSSPNAPELIVTKTAKIVDFSISDRLLQTLTSSSQAQTFPRELYIQDDSAILYAAEIPVTEEIKNLIRLLEALNCVKWQIEGFLRKAIEDAISRSHKSAVVTALRLLVVKQEASQAAGGRRVPCRYPCSEGRILLLLDNAVSVSALAQGARGLTIDLQPLARFTVYCVPWESAQATQSVNDVWTAQKEAEARARAAECVPPRPALSRVEVRFKVSVATKADLRKPLDCMEKIYLHAMGGIALGIAAVQLFADPSGNVNPQCRCYIWVCDLAEGERHLCKAFVDRLKQGMAAISTEALTTIGCRGTPSVVSCADQGEHALTEQTAGNIILRSLPANLNRLFVLSNRIESNLPLPWERISGSQEFPLSSLGPMYATTPEACDIRTLFPSSDPQPTVNLLCAVLNSLVDSQVVNMYDEVLEGREVKIIRTATSDAWLADEMDG